MVIKNRILKNLFKLNKAQIRNNNSSCLVTTNFIMLMNLKMKQFIFYKR